jgi:hypothetical protein
MGVFCPSHSLTGKPGYAFDITGFHKIHKYCTVKNIQYIYCTYLFGARIKGKFLHVKEIRICRSSDAGCLMKI